MHLHVHTKWHMILISNHTLAFQSSRELTLVHWKSQGDSTQWDSNPQPLPNVQMLWAVFFAVMWIWVYILHSSSSFSATRSSWGWTLQRALTIFSPHYQHPVDKGVHKWGQVKRPCVDHWKNMTGRRTVRNDWKSLNLLPIKMSNNMRDTAEALGISVATFHHYTVKKKIFRLVSIVT